MSNNKLIKLQPKEGDREMRYLDIEIAKMCITLKEMMENSDLDWRTPVRLPIAVKILDKVIQWIKYHRNDYELSEDGEEDPLIVISEDIEYWNKVYFDIDRELLFDLLVAANYLNVKSLLSIGCKIAAQQLNKKSVEEVRKLWQIECDLDPEEVQQIKGDNAWTQN